MDRRTFMKKFVQYGMLLAPYRDILSALIGESSASIEENSLDANLIKGNGIFTNIWVNPSILHTFKEHNIKYVFVDIGEVNKKTGRITTPKNQIESFMNNITSFEQQNNYNFLILPWNVVNPEEGYNVHQEEFRENYVAEYTRLVKQFNLPGIHVDIEAIPGELREPYLDMIKEWRKTLPQKSIISVYGGSITKDSDKNVWKWPEEFLQKVFESGADIVAPQTFDTGHLDEKMYRKYLRNQINLTLKQKKGLFRYPVPAHKPAPELASIAIEEYLNRLNSSCKWPFLGMDLFATWTMSDNDWELFEEYLRENEKEHLKESENFEYKIMQKVKDFLCSLGLN